MGTGVGYTASVAMEDWQEDILGASRYREGGRLVFSLSPRSSSAA